MNGAQVPYRGPQVHMNPMPGNNRQQQYLTQPNDGYSAGAYPVGGGHPIAGSGAGGYPATYQPRQKDDLDSSR